MVMAPHVPSSWAHWLDCREDQNRGLGRQTVQTWWTREFCIKEWHENRQRLVRHNRVMMGQRFWQSHNRLWFVAYLRWLLDAAVAIRAAVWFCTSL